MVDIKLTKHEGHNFLWIDKHLWMWDIPFERSLQKSIAKKAQGDVLVAGYGLGLVQRSLTENPLVKSVTTVEIYDKIIDLCKEEYGQIYGDVIIDDFYNFNTDKRYQTVIGDIWDDIVPQCLPQYRMFKEKAETLLRPGGEILAWGKEFYEYLIEKNKI